MSQDNNKSAQKEPTFTEAEVNKRVAEALEQARRTRLCVSTALGWDCKGLYPKIEVRVEGGSPAKAWALMMGIQRLVLECAEGQAPSNDEQTPGATPAQHFLPADAQRFVGPGHSTT